MDAVCDTHTKNLKLMCRICAGRVKPKWKDVLPKVCFDYKEEINSVYGIEVQNDKSEFYPQLFCNTCYSRIINHQHRVVPSKGRMTETDAAAVEESKRLNSIWEVKSCENDCWVCLRLKTQSRGGRPSKKKKKASGSKHADIIESSLNDNSLHEESEGDSRNPKTPTRPIKQKEFKEAQTSPFQFENTSNSTIDSCFQKPLEKPLSKIEEQLHTHLVRRKLLSSNDASTLFCKTKGQPIVFKRIKKARKSSAEATSPLKRRRSREIAKVRGLISGQSDDSTKQQQISELKRLPFHRKQNVCAKAGIQRKLTISSRYGLAIRTNLGLSWTQYRKHKRFMSAVGVKFQNESMEREEQTSILSNHIDTKTIKMQVTDESQTKEEDIAVCFVKDLPKFVMTLLDKYSVAERLTWHGGTIPEDEIWLKVGGDHGGGSFKMSLQIANLHHPNSKHNTVVFSIFEAKDTRYNLEVSLQQYADQLKSLSKMKWGDKKINIFLFGDYDFLAKIYGLSGAAGKFPCLWCHASKSQIQQEITSREDVDGRTLKTIKMDFRRFSENGQGNISKASKYNNVIHQPILPISINKVCPPYLHILLGIVKKHHTMLENECHEIDLSIGLHCKVPPEDLSDPEFCTYVKNCKVIKNLEIKETQMQIRLNNLEDTTPLQNLNASEQKLKKKIEDIQKQIREKRKANNLPQRKGPVTSNLDAVLKKHRITPQSYHGRSFIGNHCARYLRDAVYEDLCASITRVTSSMTDNEQITTRAYCVRNVYEELNRRFAEVHHAVAHDEPILEDDVKDIDGKIQNYMKFFRHRFPSCSIIPKMHFLEDHVPAWIQKWKFGMGFHGEQGGEQIHATINLMKRRVWGVKTHAKLLTIMREHHLQISLEIQSSLPMVKRRKLEK